MYISKNRNVNQMFNLFIHSRGLITISEFEKQLSLSRRSVYYSIKKLNQLLEENQLDKIQNIKNLGFYLTKDAISHLAESEKIITTRNEDLYNFSKKQRVETIIWLLINKEKVSLTSIENKFNVSRNTADQDFKAISKILINYKLVLSKNSTGHSISGTEIQKRNWVYEQFSKEDPILFSLLAKRINSIQNISPFLKEFERMTGNFFTDDAFICLSAYLDWYIDRIQDPVNRLNNTKIIPSNLIALEWAQKFLFKNKVVNLGEANYLINTVHSGQFNKANKQYGGIQEILPIAKKIIFRFNRIAGVNLKLDSLQVNLATHLLATYYRIKYDISYKHPNLNSIKHKYNQLFSFAQYSVRPFEDFLKKEIPDDEIALITLYFGGEIKAIEDANLKKQKAKVMIVCSSGIGTSRILKQQLEEKFPNVSFSKPLNTLSYENSSLEGIELIISTIAIKNSNNIKVIKVSAIPNDNDWKMIEAALKSKKLLSTQNTRINIEGLLDIISEYARIEDIDGLTKSIKHYLEYSSSELKKNKNPVLSKVGNTIGDIFTRANTSFFDHAENFKQALYLAFQPLVKNGLIEDRYIEKIYNLTEKYGPYMVIADNVLLAHARPGDGVNKTAFSFLLLKNPVFIEKKETKIPIKIIIGFGTVDTTSHLEKLNLIMKILQNKLLMNQILSVSKKEDLIKIF
ncbi:Transcriptional regulator MtlR [Oenococcus sicerae]|nr:Transcriptional regulator MtlR [Oenococcus sicerae]